MSKSDPIYVYIEGNGLAAENHRAAFEELSDFYCVVEERGNADVIDICTPVGNHLVLAHTALEEGRAVFVEKPTCRSFLETIALAGLNKTYSEALGVIEPEYGLVHPISQYAFTQEDQPQDLNINFKRDEDYYEGSKWRGTWAKAGGGVLFTHGWHVLEALLTGLDSNPVIVDCHIRNMWHDIEVEDFALVSVTTESGAIYNRQIATSPDDLEGFSSPAVLGDGQELLKTQLADFLEGNEYLMVDATYMMILMTACYYSAYISKPVVLNDLLRDPKTHPFFAGWQQQFVQRQLQSVSSH